HVEAPRHIHRTLQSIRGRGLGVGLTLNPGTPLSSIKGLLPEVDMVLVMSVNPGFGGQTFIPASLERIRRLREQIEAAGLSVLVEVDGGVTPRTGAEALVAGSAVFGAEDYAEAIRGIRGG
ncbi:MAG: ribulose-phosphate 3-epimerase, partial [Nitrospinae bacterium]|nr:ribulose-phosphate 3-epimerase [Nitrospinota bacterium]